VSSPLSLSASATRAFARLAADLQRVLGPRFVALVAYGAGESMAFAERVSAEDLHALSALAGAWHHDGLATPLVMTPHEFRRSLDAFPLEYQAILDRHVVVAGQPPFAGASVRHEDLRRACEVQARGHLIHLRQGWLQAAGHDDHLAELIERSAAPFRVLLSHVSRLEDVPRNSPRPVPLNSTEELADFAERTIGMPADLARGILELETQPERSHRLVNRLPNYLTASERLWSLVDAWRA
jgi:hypothetical protein